jgi:hypothetical protein
MEFTQPDTVIPTGSPQILNRYSYVLNNPINPHDPTGHSCQNNDYNGHQVVFGCQADDPRLSPISAASIKSNYGITLTGNYTMTQLQIIDESLVHMESGISNITEIGRAHV